MNLLGVRMVVRVHDGEGVYLPQQLTHVQTFNDDTSVSTFGIACMLHAYCLSNA